MNANPRGTVSRVDVAVDAERDRYLRAQLHAGGVLANGGCTRQQHDAAIAKAHAWMVGRIKWVTKGTGLTDAYLEQATR